MQNFNLTQTGLLYLHGFLSSPASQKAGEFKQCCQQQNLAKQLRIPQLPVEPEAAIVKCEQLLQELHANYPKLAIIGSSLGGYYATFLAEKYHAKAILINPAVKPYRFLNQHVGVQTHYHNGQEVEVTQAHIEQLKQIDTHTLSHPERYLVLLQSADETLDYRQAAQFYQQCKLDIEQGGSHAFENFADKLPAIMQFIAGN